MCYWPTLLRFHAVRVNEPLAVYNSGDIPMTNIPSICARVSIVLTRLWRKRRHKRISKVFLTTYFFFFFGMGSKVFAQKMLFAIKMGVTLLPGKASKPEGILPPPQEQMSLTNFSTASELYAEINHSDWMFYNK